MAEKVNNPFGDMGMENIINDLAEKKRKYLKSLETLPHRSEIIPVVELEQLQIADSLLRAAIEEFEDEVKRLDSTFGQEKSESFARAKNDAEQRILNNLIANLDKLDVWSHKFSTESQGTGENLSKTPPRFHLLHDGIWCLFEA